MSDRSGAMRGWTKPVRYGLIRPCPYGTADARVLSDAVRLGREAGVYVRSVLETAVPTSYRIVRAGASGSPSVSAGVRKDTSVRSPFRTSFLSVLPVSLSRCGSVTDGTGRSGSMTVMDASGSGLWVMGNGVYAMIGGWYPADGGKCDGSRTGTVCVITASGSVPPELPLVLPSVPWPPPHV